MHDMTPQQQQQQHSTALAVREAAALPVQSLGDMQTLATEVAKSGMFGACSPARALTILSTCVQERISFLEFKQRYHVTDSGQVTMRSDRMLAEFQARGGKCVWEEYSPTRAAATWSYSENENLHIEYTLEEAKAAGLVKAKSAWEKHPAAMLRARLISRAVRMLCPAATLGMYAPEELDEQDEPRVPLTDDEAERRATAAITTPFAEVVADTPTAAPAPTPTVDYSRCPMPGKLHGATWASMPRETLEFALQTDHEMMEPEHYRQVAAALALLDEEVPFDE